MHTHTHSGVWITSSPLLRLQILADTSRGRCGCCHFIRNHAAPYNPQCTTCTWWKSTPEQCMCTPWLAAPHGIKLSAGYRLKSKLSKALFKLSQQHRSYFSYFLFSIAQIITTGLCLGYQVMDASSAAYWSDLVWFFLNSVLHFVPFSLQNARAAGTMATANLDSCKKRNRLQSKTPELCVKTQIRQIWNLLEEYSACQHFCELFQNVNANSFISNCFRHSKVVWSCFSQNDNRVFWNEAWYIFHKLRN